VSIKPKQSREAQNVSSKSSSRIERTNLRISEKYGGYNKLSRDEDKKKQLASSYPYDNYLDIYNQTYLNQYQSNIEMSKVLFNEERVNHIRNSLNEIKSRFQQALYPSIDKESLFVD